MDTDLEVLLSSPPPFPGVRLHIVTEIENTPIEYIENTETQFPVNIHSIDKKNSRVFSYDECSFSKVKKERTPIIWNINNDIIEIEIIEEDPTKLPLPISGATSIQGERSHMEDRFIKIDEYHNEIQNFKGKVKNMSYYGVYDGHAGEKVADFCLEQLHHILGNQLLNFDNNEEKIEDLMERGLSIADEEILKLSNGTWKDGSCVSVVMLVDSMLYTVNLGDSHMVLCEERKKNGVRAPVPHVLSRPHIASIEEEKKRIVAAGGMVAKGRIFGSLMVSRALGDLEYKKPIQEENYVSIIPHKERVVLSPNIHRFLILASDGLWDKLTYQEAIDIVVSFCDNGEKDPAKLSKILVDEVIKRGGLDNTTAVVVLFNWIDRDSHSDDQAKNIEIEIDSDLETKRLHKKNLEMDELSKLSSGDEDDNEYNDDRNDNF